MQCSMHQLFHKFLVSFLQETITIMRNFVSLAILLCHLPLSLSQADEEPFLRAKQTAEAEMLQNLHHGIVTGQKLVQQSYDERKLFLRSEDICAQIEKSIEEDVECACGWQWLLPGFNFRCTGQERVNTLGLEGLRVYTGFVGAVPFSFGGKVEAKVCVTDGTYKGAALKWDLCLDGVLCGGIRSLGENGVCSCQVKYGPALCECEPCAGGITTSCGPFALVDICIPVPLTGGL